MFISICLKLISCNNYNNVKTGGVKQNPGKLWVANLKHRLNGYVQTDVSLQLLLNTFRHLHTLLLLSLERSHFFPTVSMFIGVDQTVAKSPNRLFTK